MDEVRAENALAAEADLLGDALGGVVVGVGDQVEPAQPEIVEAEAADETERAGRDAAPRASGAPVADASVPVCFVHRIPIEPTTPSFSVTAN